MKILRTIVVFLVSSVAVCSSVLVAHGDEALQDKKTQPVFFWDHWMPNGRRLRVYSDLPPAQLPLGSKVEVLSEDLLSMGSEEPSAKAKIATVSVVKVAPEPRVGRIMPPTSEGAGPSVAFASMPATATTIPLTPVKPALVPLVPPTPGA